MTNQTEQGAALEPCPFCGCDNIFTEPDERGSGGQWVGPVHVGCTGCQAEQIGETEVEAVAAWNRRAPVSTPEGCGFEAWLGPRRALLFHCTEAGLREAFHAGRTSASLPTPAEGSPS